MQKILENPLFNLIIRLILGLIFFFAAVGKIAEPEAFAKEIVNYNLINFELSNLIALTLPWIELIVAIFLITGLRIKASSTIAALMLIVFIFAVGSAMARNLDINCGCFGRTIQKVGWGKIFENTILLFISIYLFLVPVRKLTFENIILNKKNNGSQAPQ